MRVLIHPGLHKTGSSSIQEALSRFSKTPQAQKRSIKIALSDKDLFAILKSPVESQPEFLILSNESLFGEFYNFYSDADSRMVALSEALKGHEIVDVTFCFRSYSPWIESCFAQAIHEGRTQGPEDFVKSFLSLTSPLYARLLRQAQTIFGSDIVRARFLTSNIDMVHEMSNAWSGQLGFELDLHNPIRLNASNGNLSALWMLYQMNQSPLGRTTNYRIFLQNLRTAPSAKFSVYSKEVQNELVSRQRLDQQEMLGLLHDEEVRTKLDEWLSEAANSPQLPEWKWPPGEMPGLAEMFASATSSTRLRDKRLRSLKKLVAKILGPGVVRMWGMFKESRSRRKLAGNRDR